MNISPVAQRPEAQALAINGGSPVSNAMIQMIAVNLSEQDIDSAVAVLRSGMLAQGKQVAAFEERFAVMSDARFGAACANGTCALQLAYGALIEPGDEVLCPAWTFFATASMLVAAGATPVWVDADPHTYNIDVDDAASKITSKTTAIACTHLYGNPVDIDAVEALSIKQGLSTIYDAAQAHLATYNGRGIGTYGDAVTYSFYPTKNMTTCEGGMVTTNDEEIETTLRKLRSHGECQKYVHDTIGFNYRMSDVAGAIGLSQLEALAERTHRRRQNAETIDRAIAQIDGLHAPTITAGAESAYHQYAIRIDLDAFVASADKPLRDLFCEALRAEGVATAVHYPMSLTRQPVFQTPGIQHQPVADRLANTLFCIPIHDALSEHQLALVAEAIDKVARALRA
jgi:perosamine synthetase